MKSNTTKTRTIASFFSPPSPSKRRKLNDPLPTTGASPRLTHSPAPIDPLPTTGASPRLIRSPPPIDPLPTTGASPRSIRSPPPIDPLPTTGASPRSIHSPAPIDASSRLVSSPPETDAFPRPMISPLSNSVSSQLLLSPSSSLVFPTDISRSSADPPSRPVLSSYKTGSDNRSFQKQWFTSLPWLEYSVEKDLAYCYYCRHFGSTNILLNRNQSDSFITGFNSWKRALAKKKGFNQHETSVAHVTAAANYNEFLMREKLNLTPVDVIKKGRAEQIRKNRNRLIKISSTLLLCARQMIAIRGHEEHSESAHMKIFCAFMINSCLLV